MPYPKWILTFSWMLMMGIALIAQDETPSPTVGGLPAKLVVAWVDQGNLFARLSGSASVQLTTDGGAIIPYLSPDGRHVAYLHGDGGLPRALSVVDLADTALHQLITLAGLSSGEDRELLIGQLDWLDSATLFLNTTRQTAFGQDRRDDLWRVDIQSGNITMLLPPGEGGTFTISPDQKWIAVVGAGTYDHEDAHIRLMDVETGDLQDMLAFPAVSTGSEYRFYPQVFWEADSRTFRVAIPDRDLIYGEVQSRPVVLWQLGIDDSTEQIGSVQASFFGLPSWSDDGQHLAYLRRAGEITSNQFDLFLADGNGHNSVKYASGQAGSFGFPIWIPHSTEFIYAQGKPGTYWLGSPGTQAAWLAEHIFNLALLEDGQFVYASAPISPFELRFGRIGNNSTVLLAPVDNPYPIFDAIMAHEN